MATTAGMVKGTPDWQLDMMYETDTARMLEKAFNSEDFFPASNVADMISNADYHIGQAVTFLCSAADLANGFGKSQPIDDLIGRLEDFRCDMNAHRRKLEGKQ